MWTPRPLTPRLLTAKCGHHPPPAICTIDATRGGGEMAGVPSADRISIASAMIPECFVLWGKSVYRRVYILYGTTISELHAQI